MSSTLAWNEKYVGQREYESKRLELRCHDHVLIWKFIKIFTCSHFLATGLSHVCDSFAEIHQQSALQCRLPPQQGRDMYYYCRSALKGSDVLLRQPITLPGGRGILGEWHFSRVCSYKS